MLRAQLHKPGPISKCSCTSVVHFHQTLFLSSCYIMNFIRNWGGNTKAKSFSEESFFTGFLLSPTSVSFWAKNVNKDSYVNHLCSRPWELLCSLSFSTYSGTSCQSRIPLRVKCFLGNRMSLNEDVVSA